MTTNSNNPDYTRHPCFNVKAKGKFGRVHLPVAPKCNIQCNYCNRKYDCINESRPGVTSDVLSPEQALEYVNKIMAKGLPISVAGIAGPGDPMAEPEVTLQTMRLLRENHPELILCLSSNGMNIEPYVPELAELGVSHVTITLNGVDPEITRDIYPWVRDGKIVYKGLQASELLLARQLSAIKSLKKHNIIVKINTVIVPGVNDKHIEEVAKEMKKMSVDLLNCIPLIPCPGSSFSDLQEPDKEEVAKLRNSCEKHLPQMRHCTRCRADAVGLLGEDKSPELAGCLSACAKMPLLNKKEERKLVAVASREGILVNLHLGETKVFQIWQKDKQGGFSMLEEREAPAIGGGVQRWQAISRLLQDCRAVLVSGIGNTPKEVLNSNNIKTIEMAGFIDKGLDAVYNGKGLKSLKKKVKKKGCGGAGLGCG